MNFLKRLFSKKRYTNVIKPYDTSKGLYQLTQDTNVKCRPAKSLSADLYDKLLKVCESQPCVSGCYILDVLEPKTNEIKIFVSLDLDHPDHDLHIVGPLMRDVFERYKYTNHYFVGANCVSCPEEFAAYRRAVK